jgi:hypothetical protein
MLEPSRRSLAEGALRKMQQAEPLSREHGDIHTRTQEG